MPEGLRTRCDVCGLVFDKITYPDCPRCEQRTRTQAIAAGDVPRTFQDVPRRSDSPRRHWTVLHAMATFMAGGVCFLSLLNLMTGRAWNAVPHTVRPAPIAAFERRRCPDPAPPATPSTPARCEATGDVIRIKTQVTRRDDRTGLLYIEGRAMNVAAATILDAELTLQVRDHSGTLLSSDQSPLKPNELQPGQEASFRLAVRDDTSIQRVTLGARWRQAHETVLEESTLDLAR